MNFNTCLTLIRREISEIRSTLMWLTIFTCLVLFLIVSHINSLVEIVAAKYAIHFLYIFCGVIFASTAFSEFKSRANTRHYLLIPATAFEKALSKIITYSLGWLFLFIICWLAVSLLVAILGVFSAASFAFSLQVVFSIFAALSPILLTTFVLQLLAIFASCYFQNSVLPKLAVFSILIIVPLYTAISSEVAILLNQLAVTHSTLGLFHWLDFLQLAGQLIAVLILAGLIWLRIRETEAS